MNDTPTSRNLPEPEGERGERDARGRFLRGNRTSLRGGNPHVRRLAEAQAAVRAATSPEDLVAVLGALRDRAMTGDVAAASVWLSRVAGPPSVTIDVDVPRITDARSLADALAGVVAATAAGELDLDAAAKFSTMLGAVGDALVVAGLEERIARLERGRGAA